jgi:hypothetical protein
MRPRIARASSLARVAILAVTLAALASCTPGRGHWYIDLREAR